MSNERTSIHISADMDWDAEIAELWPDGNAPDEITADVIADLIKANGGVRRVLRDWNLIDNLELHVVVHRPNPAWKGDDVLFGAPPPRVLISSARAT